MTYYYGEIQEAINACENLIRLYGDFESYDIGVDFKDNYWIAYCRLYIMHNKLGNSEKANEYLSKAFTHYRVAKNCDKLTNKQLMIDLVWRRDEHKVKW